MLIVWLYISKEIQFFLWSPKLTIFLRQNVELSWMGIPNTGQKWMGWTLELWIKYQWWEIPISIQAFLTVDRTFAIDFSIWACALIEKRIENLKTLSTFQSFVIYFKWIQIINDEKSIAKIWPIARNNWIGIKLSH